MREHKERSNRHGRYRGLRHKRACLTGRGTLEQGSKNSPWPIIQIYFFDPAPAKGEDFGDVDFEAEMEWGGVTKEELEAAKARLDSQKAAEEKRMPPAIPLEIDPFKPDAPKGFGGKSGPKKDHKKPKADN